MRDARWLFPTPGDSDVAALCAALHITSPAARVLTHRGLGDPAAARRFLQPSLGDLHDPQALRDMPQAIARLGQAIRGREGILIYGDYDVDGTSSVVLLTKAFELAGCPASFHVPHRLKDGYGMRSTVL